MSRESSDKKAKAKKLFNDGMKLVDIAKELDIPEGTIRSWKNREKWGEKSLKDSLCNVAKENKSSATLQKKKRGGQLGNKNARGSKGGAAPLRNKNAEKHGAFSKFYWDALDEDEQILIGSMDDIEEAHLIRQLQMFSIRERRFMRNIKRFKEMEGEKYGLSVETVSKTKKLEDLVGIDGESIGSGEFKKLTETTITKTKAVMSSIITLESELTKLQKAKTKAIEILAKIRLEKQRLKEESKGNDMADDWIASVCEKEVESEE